MKGFQVAFYVVHNVLQKSLKYVCCSVILWPPPSGVHSRAGREC